MDIILSFLLLVLGIVMVIKPNIFFEITESWKSNSNTDPSKLYIFSTRVGGVMCSLVGLAGLICFWFLIGN